jgi:hypothetical protein
VGAPQKKAFRGFFYLTCIISTYSVMSSNPPPEARCACGGTSKESLSGLFLFSHHAGFKSTARGELCVWGHLKRSVYKIPSIQIFSCSTKLKVGSFLNDFFDLLKIAQLIPFLL